MLAYPVGPHLQYDPQGGARYCGRKGHLLKDHFGSALPGLMALGFHPRVTSVIDPSSQLRVGMANSSSYKMGLVVGTFLELLEVLSKRPSLPTGVSQDQEAELQRFHVRSMALVKKP